MNRRISTFIMRAIVAVLSALSLLFLAGGTANAEPAAQAPASSVATAQAGEATRATWQLWSVFTDDFSCNITGLIGFGNGLWDDWDCRPISLNYTELWVLK